jgi:hypothetical protein
LKGSKKDVLKRFVSVVFEKFKAFLEELATPFKVKLWLVLLPFLIVETMFFAVIQYKHGFALNDHILLTGVIEKILVDSLILLCSVMILRIVTRTNIVPSIFMTIYLLLFFSDFTVYYFGHTMLESHHLDLITWYSIKGFIGFTTVAFLILFLGSSFGSFVLIKKLNSYIRFSDLFRYGVILVILISVAPTDLFIEKSEEHDGNFEGNEDKNVHYILRCKNSQIRYVKKNSLVNFWQEIISKKRKSRYRVERSYEDFRLTIEKYKLPIGTRSYEPLNIKPFDHIIWFASESINLDFFSTFNDKLPLDTEAEFYEKEDIVEKMMTNYFTAVSPTLQALTATFSSHPNERLIRSGYHQNSIPLILQKNGYHTVFLRSASKYYAGENIIFQQFGFKDIIAREYFSKYPENVDYIYDWGVNDRIMLQKLIELLEEYRDKKLFVVVLGVDTHPPHGRAEYGFRNVQYPKTPESYRKFGRAYDFMRSVKNHDHDLALTFTEMKKRGLYNENTLVIATADHSCPYNNVTKQIPGIENTNLARTPLAFLTPSKLPEYDLNILSGQLDLAPTILHLLNISVPPGYWGESLFSKTKIPQFIGQNRGTLEYRTEDEKFNVNVRRRSGKYRDLIDLYNTIIVKPVRK